MMKNLLKFFPVLILIFFFVSCKKQSVNLTGQWTSVYGGAIYEFFENDFILNTTVLNSSLLVRGTYTCTKDCLITHALELSFDFGDSWQQNDGSLIPDSQTKYKLVVEDKNKILISNIEYIRF